MQALCSVICLAVPNLRRAGKIAAGLVDGMRNAVAVEKHGDSVAARDRIQ